MTSNIQTMKAEIMLALDILPAERLDILLEFVSFLRHGRVKKPALLLKELSAWQETLYLLSNPANAEHLRQSIMEAENGEVMARTLVE